MLWEAGRLTLELARASLSDSYGLKDATPYNVLYRGTEPVFIDVSSFKPREPGDPVWRAYGQFVRTFLLPLLVNQHWGIPLGDIFRSRRDGLLPQEVYRLCGPLERLKPPMLWLVSLPTWLAGKARAQGERLYGSRTLRDTRKARFILESLLARLERNLCVKIPESVSYEAAAFAAKERFIDEGLAQLKPRRVLDVGANTGHFSLRAAKAGAEVVAIDADPACVGAIWRQARELPRNLSGNILPLVVDVSRPPPALGWRNRECASFLGRAAGTFDCVMLLAVIHHLLINERVPLDEILGLAAELTSEFLAIEFIAPEDEMFRELARGREDLHIELTQAAFEAACGEHFEIVRSLALPGTQRRLYWLRKKGVRSPGPGVGREAAGRTNGR